MIVHGGTPSETTRYGPAIAVMREMGWSWAELLEAPADLVVEVLLRRGAEAEAQRKRGKLEEQRRRGKR